MSILSSMSSEGVLIRRPSEGMLNLLSREDSASQENAGFYSKYEPKEVLGRGLSSTVRKCVSRETGIEYAVKIIDKSQDEAVTESIAAEMQVLNFLPRHPNIITLQDVFESSAFIFMIFELAPGGELFDYLTQMVKLSEKKTRKIMYQIFLAVEHMHLHGVVHRDLKPENILLDEEQKLVKISDFGFSSVLNEEERLSELLGTPGYLSPEMLKCSVEADAPPYGVEIDLWACGVIMYTLLVGFPPFWHRKQLVMLRNIMEGKYEFVSPEWDDISDSAKDLLKAASSLSASSSVHCNEMTATIGTKSEDMSQSSWKQVMKLLDTNPATRLTASQALDHPFVKKAPAEFKIFSAKRRFKGAVFCIWSCYVLEKLRKTTKTVTLESIGPIPYDNRFVRSQIDACAFQIYGHWVKRGEEQNRAALFETTTRRTMDLEEIFT